MLCNRVFVHWGPTDQMFLDDSFQDFRRTRVVPDAVRIDQRNWALSAYLQAICLGTIYPAFPDQFDIQVGRFLESPYREALPADWCDGDPEGCVGDAAEAAHEFFGAAARQSEATSSR